MRPLMSAKQIRIALNEIYDLIPDYFECMEGCGDCCGLIYWTKAEDINIRHYLKEHDMEYITFERDEGLHHFIIQSGSCPYLDEETKDCKIYPVRPHICRFYGIIEELACPYNPDVRKISEYEVQEVKMRLAEVDRRIGLYDY